MPAVRYSPTPCKGEPATAPLELKWIRFDSTMQMIPMCDTDGSVDTNADDAVVASVARCMIQ